MFDLFVFLLDFLEVIVLIFDFVPSRKGKQTVKSRSSTLSA